MNRRTKTALTGAALGAGLLFLTWALALHVGVFERADQAIFKGFFDLNSRQRINRIAQFIADLCNPSPYVYLAAVPVIVALVRRRVRVVVGIGTILLGANVTTQLLKPLLAQPRAHSLLAGLMPLNPASWPSGHATAAMALALCCVLAAPARLRPAVATLGAAFAIAVSYSFLTLGWHFPSDVFGGFLVAGTWTMLVVAAISAAEARWPQRARADRGGRLSIAEALAPQAALAAGGVVLAGLVALARPHQVVSYARAHETFVIGAAAIAVLALAVASAITLAVRR